MHANLAGNLTTHPVLETRPDGEFSSKLFVAVPLVRSSLTLWHVKWLATNSAFATLAAEVNQAQAEKTSTNRVAFMEASFRSGPISPYTGRGSCVNKKIAVRGGFQQALGLRRCIIHPRMRGLCAMKDGTAPAGNRSTVSGCGGRRSEAPARTSPSPSRRHTDVA